MQLLINCPRALLRHVVVSACKGPTGVGPTHCARHGAGSGPVLDLDVIPILLQAGRTRSIF